MSSLPFDRTYWARSGLLAGCYPGSLNREEAEIKATKLIGCEVSHCINLMESGECDHHSNPFASYQPALSNAARQQGRSITFSRHAIPDCSIPTVEGMTTILNEIDLIISAHRTVYVHCWGGRGRTGTVIGCYLIRHRLTTPEAASRKLADLTAHNASVFRKIPETKVQEDFLRHWKPGA